MARSKLENAMQMDPQRFQMAKQMAVDPGGPMNNSPKNIQSVGPQPPSMTGMTSNPYDDAQMQLPQMGADILNPMNVQNSGLQQNNPVGQKLNAVAPYNLQQQPSPNAEEPMEGMRLGQVAMAQQLQSSPFMGVIGSAAIMPGALDPQMPGTGGMFLPTTDQMGMSPDQVGMPGGDPNALAPAPGAMVPGSTPQKIQKKKGKK